MRYLPLTDSDRRAMLAAIGVPSVDSLFRDVPESAWLKKPIDGLPDHMGELEVDRALSAMAAKIENGRAVLCFLRGNWLLPACRWQR